MSRDGEKKYRFEPGSQFGISFFVVLAARQRSERRLRRQAIIACE